MRRLLQVILKSVPRDLELVAGGIDWAILLLFFTANLVLVVGILDTFIKLPLSVWLFPPIAVFAVAGILVISYRIGRQARYIAWLLGAFPWTIVTSGLILYAILSGDPPPRQVWILVSIVIAMSLMASTVGSLRQKLS